MDIIIVLLILAFGVGPGLWLLFNTRKITNISEGRKEYFRIMEKTQECINMNDVDTIQAEERMKKNLRRRYNLTKYEANLLFTMGKEGQQTYVESFINNRINQIKFKN